jgi:thiamine biosynthesis lipoprotein
MSDQSARSPNRREVLQVALGLITVGGLALTNRVRRRLIRHQVPALGTLAELAVVHHNEKYARAALGAAASELKRVEALMTRFERTSDIGRANLHAGVARVRVSAETAQIVLRALEWAQASDGAFDPAIARVVDLWDVKTRRSLPAHDAVERLANRNLYRRIDVDADARSASVFVREPDAAIDLGGIAAGYGVDRAVAVLRDWGIRDGFVNVSGDIYALGHSADAEPWDVGIRSPSDPAQLRGRVALSDAAVATSGDYEQGFTLGPRRYHHIMDPHTAEPRISALHSVTITAPSCLEADAASTAVFGWQPAVAQLLLDRCSPGARLVGSA